MFRSKVGQYLADMGIGVTSSGQEIGPQHTLMMYALLFVEPTPLEASNRLPSIRDGLGHDESTSE